MSKRYLVTGEYITVATLEPLSGKRVVLGFYRGALCPEDMSDDSIRHHLDTGQIKAVEVDSDGSIKDPVEAEDTRQTDPAEARITDGLGEPNQMPRVADSSDNGPLDPADAVKAGDNVPEPKRSAKREDWVDYAVAKGADREDIEAKKVTKDDLIAVYGSRN